MKYLIIILVLVSLSVPGFTFEITRADGDYKIILSLNSNPDSRGSSYNSRANSIYFKFNGSHHSIRHDYRSYGTLKPNCSLEPHNFIVKVIEYNPAMDGRVDKSYKITINLSTDEFLTSILKELRKNNADDKECEKLVIKYFSKEIYLKNELYKDIYQKNESYKKVLLDLKKGWHLTEIVLKKRLVAERRRIAEEKRLDEIDRKKRLVVEKLRIAEQKRLDEIDRKKRLVDEKRRIAEQNRLDEIDRKKRIVDEKKGIEDTYFNADNFAILVGGSNNKKVTFAIHSIFNEDVYTVFDITNNMSALEKRIFEKTTGYKKKLQRIRDFKKELLKKEYTIVFGKKKGFYNIKKNMYEVELFELSSNYPSYYSFRGKYLNELAFGIREPGGWGIDFLIAFGNNYKANSDGNEKGIYYFKVPETIALKIEKNNYFILKFKIADYVNRQGMKFVTYNSKLIVKNMITDETIYTVKIDNDKKWVKFITDRSIRWKETFKDGKIESETPIASKKVWFRSYFRDGTLAGLVLYQNGKKKGFELSYHENGKIDTKSYYRNGKKHGWFYSYWSSGKLEKKVKYRYGKKHGPFFTYRVNGRLYDKALYRNDKIHGWYYFYSKNGSLIYKRLFRNGKLIR